MGSYREKARENTRADTYFSGPRNFNTLICTVKKKKIWKKKTLAIITVKSGMRVGTEPRWAI